MPGARKSRRARLRPTSLLGAAVVALVLGVSYGGAVPLGADPAFATVHVITRTTGPTAAASLRPIARITRSGSTLTQSGHSWRFSGVNMYWLGLDENRTDELGATYPSHDSVSGALAAAASLGATVVRSTTLGVSVGGQRSLEPQLGQFNDDAFDAIDYAVAAARADGLHLIIPLTDEWHFYEGGKHTFTAWYGYPDLPGQTLVTSSEQRASEAHFYTDPTVIAAFHAYVAHLLGHINRYTGIRLGSDPTIAAWETGNELWDAPPTWTEQTARYLKTLAPRTLVADGSASSGMQMSATGYAQRDVDIIDAHYYPIDPTKVASDAAFVARHDKAFIVGEYPAMAAADAQWLSGLAADQDVSGDLAWSMLPWLTSGPEPHDDGYTFHVPAATTAESTFDAVLGGHFGAMHA